MKKLITIFTCIAAGLGLEAQTYVYRTTDNISTADYTIVKDLTPVTINGNPSQMALTDLVMTSTPFSNHFCINAYRNGIGTPVSGRQFTMNNATNNLYGKRVLQINSDFFILFNYTDASSVQRFAVLRYNATSGIVWARYFNGSIGGSQKTVDMDYDGSGYLYIVGDLPAQSEDLWAAKVDLNGGLIWYYTYADNNNSTDETAWNIHFRSDSEIYIGATTVSGSDKAGLIVKITSTGNVSAAKKIRFFPYPATPQQEAERLFVKSDGTDVYTVALSYESGSPKSLFVARMNTSLQVQACAIYDATSFRLLPEFRLVNGDIVVAGTTDPGSAQTQSYINQFFDMSTTSFITAARYYSTISSNGFISLSYDPSNYNIFNTANIGNATGVIYRFKSYAGTGVIECDTTFEPDSLETDTTFMDFVLVKDTVDTAFTTLSLKVLNFSPVDSLICDTGASPHRLRPLLRAASVYPNPFTGELYVAPGVDGPVHIEIFALDGRLIMRRKFSEGESIIIPGNLFDPGMYLLNLTYATGETETKKIIRE